MKKSAYLGNGKSPSETYEILGSSKEKNVFFIFGHMTLKKVQILRFFTKGLISETVRAIAKQYL